jgi:hypothetical protein
VVHGSVHTHTSLNAETREHRSTSGDDTPRVMIDMYLNEAPSVAERLLSGARVDSPTASVVAQRRAAGATLAAWQSAWDKLEGPSKQK